jgi:ATP-dependent DNA ligase
MQNAQVLRLAEAEAVAQIEVLEWTGADHPRHTKFVTLRDVKDAQKVVRET